jgi:hypothetical protein
VGLPQIAAVPVSDGKAEAGEEVEHLLAGY